MTTELATKLRNFGVAAEGSITAEARVLAPKLHEAAADVEHKLHDWTSAVDAWVEAHFSDETTTLRHAAGAAYRAAVAEAHKLIDEAKAHL